MPINKERTTNSQYKYGFGSDGMFAQCSKAKVKIELSCLNKKRFFFVGAVVIIIIY